MSFINRISYHFWGFTTSLCLRADNVRKFLSLKMSLGWKCLKAKKVLRLITSQGWKCLTLTRSNACPRWKCIKVKNVQGLKWSHGWNVSELEIPKSWKCIRAESVLRLKVSSSTEYLEEKNIERILPRTVMSLFSETIQLWIEAL